jgi:hypothetical protein
MKPGGFGVLGAPWTSGWALADHMARGAGPLLPDSRLRVLGVCEDAPMGTPLEQLEHQAREQKAAAMSGHRPTTTRIARFSCDTVYSSGPRSARARSRSK